MKRAFDVLLATAVLCLSLPLWLAIAVGIKLEDDGPVFYSQERVGQYGRRSMSYKVRSMIPDAERRGEPRQAVVNDPRVTRMGRWLRASAMDELPQLWNILRGDMSFVGPRAFRPEEIVSDGTSRPVRLEDAPGFSERCQARPGLTGIAQIYGDRNLPHRQKFRYDRIYLRSHSVWLDVRLILLSFWISAKGTWEARGQKF